jgi:hypothetical protein
MVEVQDLRPGAFVFPVPFHPVDITIDTVAGGSIGSWYEGAGRLLKANMVVLDEKQVP